MEKKQVSVHAVTVHMYQILVGLLILALVLLGLKYLHLKLSVRHYTESALWQQMNQTPTTNMTDVASLIATTVSQYPQDKPLYTQPLLVENYVTTLSKQLKRDIVVMDTTRKILADTVVGNMGSKYILDENNEIGKTIQDGAIRSFTETSKDYPSGLSEIVVPMKNDKAQIVGAVLISNSSINQ